MKSTHERRRENQRSPRKGKDNGKEQGKGQCENTDEVQQVQVYSTTEANAMWNVSDSNINALNELVRRRLTQTQEHLSSVPSLTPNLPFLCQRCGIMIARLHLLGETVFELCIRILS